MSCGRCGTDEEHGPCPDCGVTQHIGDDYRCPHGPVTTHKGFEPYFDVGLGRQVTGYGDINKECRPHWKDGEYIHIQPADRSALEKKDLDMRREQRHEDTLRRMDDAAGTFLRTYYANR